MRVQVRLRTLGLYDGPIDGELRDQTRSSLKAFQRLKKLPETGTMTTPTLNSLGVPAAN
jgi:His-Xaa-Ser repeat protein HxsA